jgi:hypothetical protein
MTWKPASVEKKPGHVRVSGNNIEYQTGRVFLKHVSNSIHDSEKRVKGGFFLVGGVIYYVNHAREVYETNIRYPFDKYTTFFDPVGRGADNTPVLFRKLHKLEWLFT